MKYSNRLSRIIKSHKPACFAAAVILIAVSMSPSFGAPNDEERGIRIRSVISEVVVYKDRAAIERTAQVELPEGHAEILFPHLPEGVLDDTVRIKSDGGAVTIMGIEVEKKYLVKSRQKRIREIEEKIEELRRGDNTLVDRMNAARSAIKFIESVNDFAAKRAHEGILYKGINLNEMSETMAFVEKNMLKEQEKIRQIVEKRREISDSIRVLEKKLGDIAGTRYLSNRGSFYNRQTEMISKSSVQSLNQYNEEAIQMEQEIASEHQGDREKWAVVSLKAKKAGTYTLKLTYVISGASWDPLYDVRTDMKEGKIELSYYGMVKQTTGEEWNNVALFLSTADPRRAANPPELAPWLVARYIDRYDIEREIGRRLEGAAGAADYASTGIAVRKELEARGAMTKIQERGTSVTYRVPSRRTVASGADPKKTPIEVIPFDAKNSAFSYVAVPERSEFPFLRVRIKNESDYAFLPGSANLYLDGDYVGRAAFAKTVMPGKSMTFHFGTDQGLRITKTLMKKYREEKGLLGGDVRVSFHYRIKIDNNRKKEASLLVIDGIPYSQESKITVDIDSIDPAPLGGDRERKRPDYGKGIRRWRVTVPALASKVIDIKFHVQHPKEMKVGGGI